MKLFCETSSVFELDNIKNAAILRDFLIFQSWQHQKRRNFARLPLNMEVQCRAVGLVPMLFATLTLHLSKALRLPRKSDARSYEVLHLSRKIILANLKIWCCKMAAPLRKSAPWPPNISDEHVSCTAPATRNDIWTSNSGPGPSVCNTFGLEMCFAPQRRALFRQRNF